MKQCSKKMKGNAIQTIRITFLNKEDKEFTKRKLELFCYMKDENEVIYRRIYFPKGDYGYFCMTFRAKHNSIKLILSNISKNFKKEVIKVEIISGAKAYSLYERRK